MKKIALFLFGLGSLLAVSINAANISDTQQAQAYPQVEQCVPAPCNQTVPCTPVCTPAPCNPDSTCAPAPCYAPIQKNAVAPCNAPFNTPANCYNDTVCPPAPANTPVVVNCGGC